MTKPEQEVKVDRALAAYQQGLRDGAVRIANEIKERRVVFFELGREEHTHFILTTALTDFITEQRRGAEEDEPGVPSAHRDWANAAEVMLDKIESAFDGEGQDDDLRDRIFERLVQDGQAANLAEITRAIREPGPNGPEWDVTDLITRAVNTALDMAGVPAARSEVRR